MKKRVMCITLAAILLVMAIPAFATNSTYSNSYSATYVDDYFNTDRSISKADTESWVKIQDKVTYTRYYDKDTDAKTNDKGSHLTCLITSSGRTLSGTKKGTGSCTITFSSASEIGNARTVNTVKLQIQKPNDGTTSNVYLKTSGSMVGEAKQGIEVDSISPDLDAE